MVINKWVTDVKASKFSGHYLRYLHPRFHSSLRRLRLSAPVRRHDTSLCLSTPLRRSLQFGRFFFAVDDNAYTSPITKSSFLVSHMSLAPTWIITVTGLPSSFFSIALCSCSVLFPGKHSKFTSACSAPALRNIKCPITIHYATCGFASIVSPFPVPAISNIASNSLFLASVHKFVPGRFADPPVAFSPFQRYTYHSSNSLSQPLEPSRFHNYNDTIVNTVHIGFLISDSYRTHYIRFERCSPLPQQVHDSARLHRLVVKLLKTWNLAPLVPSTFKPK